MEADHYIGGEWGCRILFIDDEAKHPGPGYEDKTFEVSGWLPRIPEVGDTLACEFQHSWIRYEFIEVKRASDPPDMFFGVVKCLEQELKDESG